MNLEYILYNKPLSPKCNVKSCIHPLAIDGDLGLYSREARTGPSILKYRQLSPFEIFL
uniref:Uncharacterized protein n=1 Tax=Aegilops tauschii subsp. strangulata TaxID=200361 RepID=A0A453QHE6_AEGTS